MKRSCSFDAPRPKKKVRFAEPLVQDPRSRTLVQQLSSEVENLLGSFLSGTNAAGNLEEHQSSENGLIATEPSGGRSSDKPLSFSTSWRTSEIFLIAYDEDTTMNQAREQGESIVAFGVWLTNEEE